MLIWILLFASGVINAQEIKADLSYKYIYANEWDKAIQTYNFSRPFIVEKQPLLIHGMNTSVTYFFESSKKITQGINISYSFFRSYAGNENLQNELNLHFLNLGYVIHYENMSKWKSFYSELIIGATSTGLFRSINGEAFEYDEKQSKAFGIGGEISLKNGYDFIIKDKMYLSPFIQLGYTPFIYSPNTEAVINQTKGLTSKSWTSILTANIGLSFHFKRN